MGVSRSPRELARKVQRLHDSLNQVERDAVKVNAENAKQNALREVRRHVPSGRLRNVGKKGAPLRVRVRIERTSGRSAEIKALGQWQLVENPTRKVPYAVTSRHAQGTRRSRQAAVLAGTYKVGAQREGQKWIGGEIISMSDRRGREIRRRVGGQKVGAGVFSRGRRAMITPNVGGWRAYAVIRKPRAGKYPWRRARDKTAREAPMAYAVAAEKQMKRIFR